MLHMILGILKIIGILLGMIVLLLLAVLLAFLFVPVRYRLAAKAQSGQYRFSLRGSWLLHIVSASVAADSVGGREIAVRLFGIRLPLFRAGEGGTSGGKAKKIRKDRKEKGEGKEKKKRQREKQGRREESDSADRQKDSQSSGIHREAEQVSQSSEIYRDVGQDSTEQRLEHNPESDGKKQSVKPLEQPEQQEQPRSGILQKIRFQCRRIYDKIRQMIQTVRSAWRKLPDLRRRMAESGRKLVALLHRPGELLEFLEEYEAREIFGGFAGHLAFLVLHYKPRRIRGYLRFGTGNPATTGQLAGLAYLFLPARADRFEVLPEFNETIFETDAVCSGHIRAVHALRVLLRGFRDKKLRRMINKLRKRGDS